jgi:hypothetical protein
MTGTLLRISAVPVKTIPFDHWLEGLGSGVPNPIQKEKAVEGQASLFDLLN